MDLPSEVRSVHSGIALASDVERIAPECGEGLVEVLKAHKGIIGLGHVTVQLVISAVAQ